MHFSKIEGRPSILENWLMGAPLNFGKPSHMMIIRKIWLQNIIRITNNFEVYFSKIEGRPSILENLLMGGWCLELWAFLGGENHKKRCQIFCKLSSYI